MKKVIEQHKDIITNNCNVIECLKCQDFYTDPLKQEAIQRLESVNSILAAAVADLEKLEPGIGEICEIKPK